MRRRQRPEVPVPVTHKHTDFLRRTNTSVTCTTTVCDAPVQVKGSHRPVQGRADDDKATGSEGDAGDAACVFGEGDEAEAAVGVPHLHLREQADYDAAPQVSWTKAKISRAS